MKTSSLLVSGGIAALLAAGSAQAGLSDFWSAVIDTTPAGLARASSERPGDWQSFWADTVEGAKYIMEEGNSLFVAPTYTNHPRWDWPDRDEKNAWPFGMGLGRQVIDEKGNERMFYLVSFIDSNYRIEPMAGYSWVARWPLGSTGLHVGAGYLAGITMRGDFAWIPCPLPLPVAKIGTDTASFYGTYIPFANVFFFYTTITLDDSRRMPLSAESPWVKTPNLLFGGWGWQRTDNGEKKSRNTIESGGVWNVGLRHYSGRSWHTEFKYKKSSHDMTIPANGSKGRHTQNLNIETYSLVSAYNMDVTRTFRLYAGAGFGISRAESSTGSDWSVHPATTLGLTWAFSDCVHLTASMDTNFGRFKGVVEDRAKSYKIRPVPTDFMVNLGIAF